MKKLYTILVAVLLTSVSYAQAPEKMSYQALVRDANNDLVVSQDVGIQISILKGSEMTPVYVETQTPTTNINGLVTLEIGTGNVENGDFSTIDWGADTYFIETETDPTGGTNYTITGTSELLSVPYALYATKAGSAIETQTLTDVVAKDNKANGQLKKLNDPTDAQDATTKAYVDGKIKISEEKTNTEIDEKIATSEGKTNTKINEKIAASKTEIELEITGIEGEIVVLDGKVDEVNADIDIKIAAADLITAAAVTAEIAAAKQNLSSVLGKGNKANKHQIKELKDPTDAQDATTKAYVDTHIAASKQNLSSVLVVGNIANSQLKEVTDPTDAQDATTKAYVDTAITASIKTLSEIVALDNEVNGQLKEITDPTDAQDATTKAYVDTAITASIKTLSEIVALDNEVNGQLKEITDPTDVQDATTKLYVDTEITTSEGKTKAYVDTEIAASNLKIQAKIGDFMHGGIVFWVDETGQHGLVCAKKDQGAGHRWYAGTFGNTHAKGDGVYAGKANTTIIIAAQVAIGDDNNTYAARICNELQVTEAGITYGDWYLPSKYELNLMFLNKAIIDATAAYNGGSTLGDSGYWSSTEDDGDNVWGQFFNSGGLLIVSKESIVLVRAIRSF